MRDLWGGAHGEPATRRPDGPLALVAPAAAQLPEAEDAFARGDYRIARQLYDSVLALDSLNPRALYRLAVLDSWDGSAGATRWRGSSRCGGSSPTDLDIMVAHAKVLSWAGRTSWSEALYDSVLATAPDRVDALAGRARAVAWDGDLDRAERLWREALERHPDEAEILVGSRADPLLGGRAHAGGRVRGAGAPARPERPDGPGSVRPGALRAPAGRVGVGGRG